MRKLKLQVQMTVDGFIGGPNGELDWMTWEWDDELKEYADKIHQPVDTILLGRKMTDGFIKHWTAVAANPADEEHEFAKKMINTPKIVFTRTLDRSDWPNTEIATGDLAEEVNKLKDKEGGDIIVYGGAEFDTSLIKAGLIDEYHLFINPIVLGNGLTIFNGVEKPRELILASSTPYECGIVVQRYEPKRAEQVQTA
jgi:dihydrofolate reductase